MLTYDRPQLFARTVFQVLKLVILNMIRDDHNI